eukprot:CCRYP_003416-RA/>CCRYP_003416-RA protein AED:0.30 eAED:0.30 QI:0/0/0/1/1/1/3/0/460
MILYHTDSNSIWVEPTKNRTEGKLIIARTRALSQMRACGLTPRRQVLDNEASAAYKQAILNSGLTYQLVPPDDHHRNVAEKAIQTWKDHFITVLSGTADTFPLHLWCQLIPHMERQLNLLRQSNANSKISEYAHLYGPHDYNALPFVPLGWVIGTSTEHYRCWKIWSPATRSTRIAATVFFKHKHLTNRSISPADALIAAAANLTHVIQHNAKAKHVGAKNLHDLQRLQQFFSDTAKQQLIARAPPKPVTSHAQPPRVPTPMPLPTIPVVSDDKDSDEELEPPPRVPAHRPVPSMPCPQPTTAPPALNTCSRARSITHETMLHILATLHINITAAQATQRRYPTGMLHTVLDDKTGTDTIVFIHKTNVPQDRWKDITYGRIVANICPPKEDLYRIRLTVGGNHINFPGDCGTPTANMITVKILLNSIISMVNAKFMTINIQRFLSQHANGTPRIHATQTV